MILLYHGIVPDESPPERTCIGQALRLSDFKRQVRWLQAHHPIIPLAEYLAHGEDAGTRRRRPVVLTFDDGYRQAYECVHPFLAAEKIPATFFIATGHLEGGDLLWFSTLKALCFEPVHPVIRLGGKTFPLRTRRERIRAWEQATWLARMAGDPAGFCQALVEQYPLPEETRDFYGGMTHAQVREAGFSGLFEIGAHSVTHPLLDRLPVGAQGKEINEGRRVLEEILGKPIRYFAYPGGEYDRVTLKGIAAAGFEAALAVLPKRLGGEARFEIGRVGIYSASLLKLQMKYLGVGGILRRFGIRTG